MNAPAAFTYASETGTVKGPTGWPRPAGVPEVGEWSVCPHLRATLDAQLQAGARIEAVTGPGSWSLIDLDVQVDRVRPSLLPVESSLRAGLEYWSNTDSHYPILSGLNCKPCRQTLSWPPVEEAPP